MFIAFTLAPYRNQPPCPFTVNSDHVVSAFAVADEDGETGHRTQLETANGNTFTVLGGLEETTHRLNGLEPF